MAATFRWSPRELLDLTGGAWAFWLDVHRLATTPDGDTSGP